jgi:predicted acyl esterase
MRRKRQFVTALLACLVMAALGLGHTSDSQPTRHDAMVRMDDGVELNTSVFAPDGRAPSSKWPAVVFVHGWGESKNLHLENCESYARDGYVTMTYTVRAQGMIPEGAPSGGVSTMMGPREEKDFRAMISWLKRNHPVDQDRVGIMGRSQGGIHSWFASQPTMGIAVSVPQNFPVSSTDAMLRNDSINPRFIDVTQTLFVDPVLRDQARSLLLQYDSKGIEDLMKGHGEYRPMVSEVQIPVWKHSR